MSFTKIPQKVQNYLNDLNSDSLNKVFEFAKNKYKGGSNKMASSLELINLLLIFKPDASTIAAALLYQLYKEGVVDDIELKKITDLSICEILMGVKKIHELNYAENDRSSQVDIMRKMFLAMAKDLRVVLIGLSQRLLLMQNLNKESTRSEEEKKIVARETLEVYVPIADRLGVYRMKIKLEDLSFKYTNPLEYEEILNKLEKFGKNGVQTISTVRKRLDDYLKLKGLDVSVFGRVKSVYSIYRKLKRKNLYTVDDLYDIFAMRIVLNEKCVANDEECVERLYQILGMIHSEWTPLSSRFKDYVSIPKPNGYRSLHTVVLGIIPNDQNQAVEIQIRSDEMHREAEYGVASHWLYKKTGSANELAVKSQADWLRGLRKIHVSLTSEYDVMKEIEIDVFKDRIFVLTPKGEVKDLPVGSTIIDFAYNVHTEVGNTCYMAKVNDNVVPLSYELKSGDMVKIITKKDVLPKLEWLSLAKTGLAKGKIKAWFNSLNREAFRKTGRRIINKHLERINKPGLDNNYSILKSCFGKNLTLNDRELILEEVGKGSQFAGDVLKHVYPEERQLRANSLNLSDTIKKVDPLSTIEGKILVGGEGGLPIKIARCCCPGVKDGILGYVTRGNRITIHKQSCLLLNTLDAHRMLEASWK